MKKQILILFIFLLTGMTTTAQVGINLTNTPPNPKAMLDVSSGTKGMLIPHMTAAQKAATAYPVPIGLTVYDQTTNPVSVAAVPTRQNSSATQVSDYQLIMS